MARLLAYLVGLPHHGSPRVFPTCSQFIHAPKFIDDGLHPLLEGKGQVAASFGKEDLRCMKKVSTQRVVNKLLPFKHALPHLLSPEACGGSGRKRDQL